MRQTHEIQSSIQEPWLDLDAAKELRVVSDLLDQHPKLTELVWQDLVLASGAGEDRGAKGLTGEQVLRALILKQMNGWSYRELAFHLADSRTYGRFCRLGLFGKSPSKSTLQAAIKAIRAETLAAINQEIVAAAVAQRVEPARKVRVDATVVEANIHHPTDSGLLWDCVRVLTRLLREARKHLGEERVRFSDRTRRAKKRHIGISYARRKKDRKPLYRDLMRVTQEQRDAAAATLALEPSLPSSTSALTKIFRDLERYIGLTDRVLDQTRRRIVDEQSVPAGEKVISIFEDHADIIVKDRRETFYGHKICLTGGASSMILDCVICKGNPADSTLAEGMIDRQVEILGRPPRQAVFDGGFASNPNLKAIKSKGVKDVAFSKRRGIEISEMVKSSWVYRRLKHFRAGIEGNISFLKRIFGLSRCTWRSLPSFESYVWGSIVSFNLLVMARHLLS